MPDINNLITDNIGLWTSAIKKRNSQGRGSNKKITLTGIKKLRELILELAVRGKLVPQDTSDEPASVLLEKIAKEKIKLVTAKKIKKQNPLPIIADEEKPFDIALGWEWVSFGTICEIERGGSPRPIKSFITEDEDGLNWIKIGDTDIGGKYITSTAEKITKEGLKKTREVYPGDFLLTNSMSFGRPYITKIKGCIHDGWLRISPPSSLDKDYLYSLLSSPFIIRAFKKSASGAVVMNLNAEKVRSVTIALPPISEQHRIVAKVDELMVLCDQLEQQTEESFSAHQTLVEVLLSTLTESKNAEGFQTSWQRIAEHFDLLFTTEHSIEQLKQTILQLAVMGKLVPQNPSDEPASALLEKIVEEKAQLIADKKIKKQKPLPAITDEEKPFTLPSGWEWERLGIVCRKVTDGAHNPPPNTGKGYPMLSCKEVNFGKIDFSLVSRFVDQVGFDKEDKRTAISPGDILLNIVASIGRSAVVPENVPKFVLQRNVAVLDSMLEANFFTRHLASPLCYSYYAEHAKGTAQQVIYLGKLSLMPLAIPPLAEQHRIVAKVDELMALCEQLKAHLSDAQTTQLHLADAVVEQALN